MVITSNRSPSPLSSKRTQQSRNPDSNSAPRRSFTGNQFLRPPALSHPRNSFNSVTPANSPASGFGRKSFPVHDEKENETDTTTAKSLPAGMTGTKNFMAPTFSAASKFTPSPRQKKVLAERNDPVRTSITLSDGKATFFSGLESPVGNTPEPKDDVVSTINKAIKKVTFSDDCISKNSVCSSPIIAPLDADPFVPPYDPKTNFLSPRPQFLHYKPIPRVEALLDQEMGDELGIPRSLEDNLLEALSESFSDTDSSEELVSEDHSPKLSEDVLPEGTVEELVSEDHSPKLCEDVLSQGAVEEDLHVPESIIPNSPEIGCVSEESAEEVKEEEAFESLRQKRSFWKPVLVLLVLFLAGASLWADVSPFVSTSVFETLESPKIDFSRKENMEELGLRFQKFSFDSISRLSLLMNRFGGGGHLAGNVHFVSLNLTSDLEDHNGFSMCLKEKQKMPEQVKEDFLEDEEDEEEQSDLEVPIQEPEMDFEDSEEWESEADIAEETSPILENADPISEADMVEESSPILENADPISEADIVEETSPISENVVPIFKADMNATSEAVLSAVEDTSSDNVVLPEIASKAVDSAVEEVETASSDEKLQGSFFQIIAQLWGIAPLIAAVVSAAATLFFWKRNVRVSAMDSVPEVSVKKLQHSRSEELFEEGSGSSEMSSTSRSEVHSHKRARRDSTASSSSDFSMYSYGSFTTYEKIPRKHKASGEGEILTPVRRSSRFRMHVSS